MVSSHSSSHQSCEDDALPIKSGFSCFDDKRLNDMIKAMDKADLQTLKGFRDFLPDEAKKRQYLIEKIRKVFELYGFEPLETPALEYKEILTGKYGEEADKLIYSFKDAGGRDVALRYDQTVPTARVLASYKDLIIPFKRYQIQTVWRAEKPQKGRYRELLQCDADIYGSLSPIADAEIIALSNSLYKSLGFKNYKIFINDRKILFDLMNFASIPQDLQVRVISEIDKLDRKPEDEIKSALSQMGINEESINHLFMHIKDTKPTPNLKDVIKFSEYLGVPSKNLIFQARLARGLDYYTSIIFEIKIDGYDAGSVLGGGRYDHLIEKLSGINIPAVGFAVGFDRTLEAMSQFDLFPKKTSDNSVLVTIFSEDLSDESALVAANLRENGIPCEIYPDFVKLEKQLKYADKKGADKLIIIGPDEKAKNQVVLKDLKSGYQEDVKLADLIEKLKK